MRLGQPLWIVPILCITGTIEQRHAVFFHALLGNQDALLSFALRLEAEDVSPVDLPSSRFINELQFNAHLGITAGMQTTQFGQTTPIFECLLYASAIGLSDRAQKSKIIQ